jgi:ketosteroid isomerase-like protein
METALPRPDQPTDFAAVVRDLYASFRNSDVEAMLSRITPDVEWSEPR